ncbi:hypothetical protein LIER_12500 [Lithospermum erythrorhizon]|uniref:Uncharacterized protein n=1 Tax=Lithospermum erythrorhizon TaxID=34254 RepID=A0AAV3PTD1_LITER
MQSLTYPGGKENVENRARMYLRGSRFGVAVGAAGGGNDSWSGTQKQILSPSRAQGSASAMGKRPSAFRTRQSV